MLLGTLLSKKIFSLLVLLVGLGWGWASSSLADIYKYVDMDGVAHYTNVPTDSRFQVIIKEKRVQFRLGPGFEKYDSLIWKAARQRKFSINGSGRIPKHP